MENHRARRVSEALREELGELISYELSDPRIAETTVTEVLVSSDMKNAQVRLHFVNPSDNADETLAALDRAKNFLKHQLAERLTLFRIPELHFESDVTQSGSPRMESLIKRIKRGRPRD